MKKLMIVMMLGLASATAFGQAEHAKPGDAAQQPASQAHVLTRAELDKLLAQPASVLILDVRRPDELISIGGFPAYLSIQAKDLENSLAWIPKDRTIVTVSNHAGRAKRAVDLLVAKGFKVAGAVGVQDYEAQGGKLTRITAPAPKTASVQQAAEKPRN